MFWHRYTNIITAINNNHSKYSVRAVRHVLVLVCVCVCVKPKIGTLITIIIIISYNNRKHCIAILAANGLVLDAASAWRILAEGTRAQKKNYAAIKISAESYIQRTCVWCPLMLQFQLVYLSGELTAWRRVRAARAIRELHIQHCHSNVCSENKYTCVCVWERDILNLLWISPQHH